MKKVHMIVHGYVQGVFFRHYTKKTALSLGLKGYTRNMPDGTVEVVAEGNEDKIKKLIEFCKKGPEAANVSKIDVKFEKASNEFKGFGRMSKNSLTNPT
jgi:acylphosphatase